MSEEITEIPRVPGNTKGRAIHFARQHEKILRDAFRIALANYREESGVDASDRALQWRYIRGLRLAYAIAMRDRAQIEYDAAMGKPFVDDGMGSMPFRPVSPQELVAHIASQGTTPRGVTSRARVSNYFRNLIDRLRRLTGRRIG